MGDTHTDVRASAQGCYGGAAGEGRELADILMRIGDKWTVMVVGALSLGSMRYSQIFRIVGGVSQRMLTVTLKTLERDGIVTRTMHLTIPPRVDYELTERGQTLVAPLQALWCWASDNKAAIEASRRERDDKARMADFTARL